jgi:hypothetical protein
MLFLFHRVSFSIRVVQHLSLIPKVRNAKRGVEGIDTDLHFFLSMIFCLDTGFLL